MNNRIKEVLTGILERFKTGDIPQAIAYSFYPILDIASSKWSLLNRILMSIARTQDARGFRQWQEVNRYVKKGAKAFHILAPRLIKRENEDGEEEKFLAGFLSIAVFRLEDTEGQPLDYQQLELPELPLIQIAEEWGISVEAIPRNYHYYGSYSNSSKQISLATKEEVVFFHELSHAAHAKVKGQLKSGQDWQQEIVAELSAATLSQMVGKIPGAYLGNCYQYIDSYAQKANLSPLTACLQVMTDVEKVLQRILGLSKGGETSEKTSYA